MVFLADISGMKGIVTHYESSRMKKEERAQLVGYAIEPWFRCNQLQDKKQFQFSPDDMYRCKPF